MKPVENMSFVGSEFPVWKSLVFVVAQELFSKELFFHLFLVSVWKRHENAAQEEGCLVLHCFKEKTYKMKAWTGSARRIPHQVPTAKGRAADPGCSQLHPAASPCSSRTKRLSRTHREVWNRSGEQQMDPMLSTCPNATAITQGTLPGVGQKGWTTTVLWSATKNSHHTSSMCCHSLMWYLKA